MGRSVGEEEEEVTSGDEEDEEERGPLVALRQYSMTLLREKKMKISSRNAKVVIKKAMSF